MKTLDVLGLGAILCAAPMAMGADTGAASEGRPAAATVAQDVNLFAADLYAHLRSTEKGNLFFSPQSISTALAMTYAGARGETAEQMARTMHFSLPQDRLPPAYAELMHALRGGGTQSYRLSIANRLWGRRGMSFLEPFVEVTRRDYGAELGLVDFATNAEGARGEINGWVGKETEQKIRDLIPAGVLGPDTRLVLANAIYFRGDWAHQFEKSATREQPFHVLGGTTVAVPLMFAKMTVGFGAQPDGGLKVVELPYKGDDLSMLVLLPDTSDGLADMEAKLTAENLRQWTTGLVRRDVLVYLPRFSEESGFGLGSTLAAMGMPLAFSDGADFSGMNGKRDLSISAVVHKARVDVDEQGTEAAAATGVAVAVRSARPEEPPTFRADHPFVFFIRHNPTGAILFLGRLTNPKP
jgi:serpin B